MPAKDPTDIPQLSADISWYCVKTQPKREAIAFGALTALPDVEAFFPRVRYKRALAKGPRAVVEALFPGYLFAKFAPARKVRAVRYARGVSYIVKRGREFAPVPETIVKELHALAAGQVLELPPEPWKAGEKVRVIAGIFRGTSGKVAGLVPARQRVQILLELLGQENRVELPLDELEPRHVHPLQILSS
ncbi:MAG TPA: transcription termination/antitermination NusG family protein [Opitutales bacterium]|jgi:transcriptional antiterminator RfaH|nr:transcription termination/antitermination NusG family protein [Opitutales bacterium]